MSHVAAIVTGPACELSETICAPEGCTAGEVKAAASLLPVVNPARFPAELLALRAAGAPGAPALADAEPVGAGAADGEPPALRLEVSLAVLEDARDDVRTCALDALETFAETCSGSPEAGGAAVRELARVFASANAADRRLALKVMGDIASERDIAAESGNHGPVTAHALDRALHDDDTHVVCAALELVARLAPEGDAEALDVLTVCLKEGPSKHGEDVTFGAMRAVAAVGGKGNLAAEAALGGCLSDGNGYVRLLALDILGAFASPGRQESVDLLAKALEDRQGNIRHKALEVLSGLLPAGDTNILAIAMVCLLDESDMVRQRALSTLGLKAAKGSQKAIDAVCECLGREEPGSQVRCVALDVLGELAATGCEQAEAAAKACLEDPDDDVREAAKDCLGALRGDA